MEVILVWVLVVVAHLGVINSLKKVFLIMNFFHFQILNFLKTVVILTERRQPKKSDQRYFMALSKRRVQSLLLPAVWLKALIPISLIFSPLFTSPLVVAQDFIFEPKVMMGIMRYKYEVGTSSGESIIRDRVKLDETLPFFGIGATLAFPTKSFISGSFQTTITEDFKEDGILTTSNLQTFSSARDTKLKRRSFSISFGHKIVDNLSVFLGYRRGKTEYNWIDGEYDGKTQIGTVHKDNDFSSEGPFIGTGYNFPINWGKVKGRLGVHLTVLKLNSDVITSRNHEPTDAESKVTLIKRRRKEQIFSRTVGYQLGISWNGRVTEQWPIFYGISLDGSWYNFDPQRGTFSDDRFDDDKWHQIIDLAPYDVRETVYSFNFLLRYRF
jgi:hypothetical protein